MTTVTNEQFDDIRYEIDGPTAVVTIARPERYNAFRGRTVEELVAAFRAAWADRAVRAIILTGEGDKAFCSGGDVKQRAETGDYGPTKSGDAVVFLASDRARYVTGQVLSVSGGLTMAG